MTEQRGTGTAVVDTIAQTLEANTSRKVFGEPVSAGGVTVIPAAKVSGRGGGGGGAAIGGVAGPATGAARGADHAKGDGSGGGLGQSATPVGAFVLKDDRVTWRPAVDVNKIIIGAQAVAVVALLTLRSLLRRRAA